jgi:predicted amidohydrolase YtcJ
VTVAAGRFSAVGEARDMLPTCRPKTQVIDLGGRRAIPGLMDSHFHLIRGGLNYKLELRWDGVPTLVDAMSMLKRQVENTPSPRWVRESSSIEPDRRRQPSHT